MRSNKTPLAFKKPLETAIVKKFEPVNAKKKPAAPPSPFASSGLPEGTSLTVAPPPSTDGKGKIMVRRASVYTEQIGIRVSLDEYNQIARRALDGNHRSISNFGRVMLGLTPLGEGKTS